MPFSELINPQTLRTELRFIAPGSDFHRLYAPDGSHPSRLGSGLAAGVFTATLTSLYVGEESEELQQMQDAMMKRLDQMEKTIAKLSEQLPKPGDN